MLRLWYFFLFFLHLFPTELMFFYALHTSIGAHCCTSTVTQFHSFFFFFFCRLVSAATLPAVKSLKNGRQKEVVNFHFNALLFQQSHHSQRGNKDLKSSLTVFNFYCEKTNRNVLASSPFSLHLWLICALQESGQTHRFYACCGAAFRIQTVLNS